MSVTKQHASTKKDDPEKIKKTGKTKHPQNFLGLYLKELRSLFDAENQILGMLPAAIKAAFTENLKDGLQQNANEVKEHIVRLEKIFAEMQEEPYGESSKGMKGLMQEMKEIVHGKFPSDIRDAALIASAQRISHYKISCYGTVSTFAKQLDLTNAASSLTQILKEEIDADETLTFIAEGSFFIKGVNKRAIQESRGNE